MKVKTAELTGRTLDRMVMIALGHTYQKGLPEGEWAQQEICKAGLWRGFNGHSWSCLTCIGDDRPSTDWAHGGPIIEQEGITVSKTVHGFWESYKRPASTQECYQVSDDPLSAAMRCYVASKLGDEVDIPEELL